MPKSEKKRERMWSGTINNYNAKDLDLVKKCPCEAIVAGYEVGDNGTPHIQFAVYWKHAKTFNGVKRWFPRAHLEPSNGTWEQNVKYCLKDGKPLRHEGEVNQGKRNDLKRIMNGIAQGTSRRSLMEEDPLTYAKYHRFFDMYRHEVERDASQALRDVEVIIIWGDTHCGKTEQAYKEQALIWSDYDQRWWDDYRGHKVICFDEFVGQLPITLMLRWLDKYPVRLNVKGGFTYAQWTKVYITSNRDPTTWYPNVDDKTRAAFFRRINKIIHRTKGPMDKEVNYA